jgi:hypothetical protein
MASESLLATAIAPCRALIQSRDTRTTTGEVDVREGWRDGGRNAATTLSRVRRRRMRGDTHTAGMAMAGHGLSPGNPVTLSPSVAYKDRPD